MILPSFELSLETIGSVMFGHYCVLLILNILLKENMIFRIKMATRIYSEVIKYIFLATKFSRNKSEQVTSHIQEENQ